VNGGEERAVRTGDVLDLKLNPAGEEYNGIKHRRGDRKLENQRMPGSYPPPKGVHLGPKPLRGEGKERA